MASKISAPVGNIKCVLVGDDKTGKTTLLITYTTRNYPSEYIPTVFDNYSANVLLPDGTPITLGLWDTAGMADYDRLRPLSYPNTDVFMFTFDVDKRQTLNNVITKWIPETSHHCPDAARILVACRSDLRDSKPDCVTKEEAQTIASENNMLYFETSALNQDGLDECFSSAAQLGYEQITAKSRPFAKHWAKGKAAKILDIRPEPIVSSSSSSSSDTE